MDRLLARALKARDAPAEGGACLDAETLAAWADERSARVSAPGVEAHAADCARSRAARGHGANVTAAGRIAVAHAVTRLVVPLAAAATVGGDLGRRPQPPARSGVGRRCRSDGSGAPAFLAPATAAPVPPPRALSREMRDDQLQAKKAENERRRLRRVERRARKESCRAARKARRPAPPPASGRTGGERLATCAPAASPAARRRPPADRAAANPEAPWRRSAACGTGRDVSCRHDAGCGRVVEPRDSFPAAAGRGSPTFRGRRSDLVDSRPPGRRIADRRRVPVALGLLAV